jgi:hypothetical protein
VSNWRKAEGMVFLEKGVPFKPAILENAIKDAGFTPTWMEIRAAGILMKKDNYLILRIEEIPQEFILVGDKTKDMAKFASKKIFVTGNVQLKKGQLTISVKKFGFEEK